MLTAVESTEFGMIQDTFVYHVMWLCVKNLVFLIIIVINDEFYQMRVLIIKYLLFSLLLLSVRIVENRT